MSLPEQLDYLEASSPFYRERIQGRRELTDRVQTEHLLDARQR